MTTFLIVLSCIVIIFTYIFFVASSNNWPDDEN
jgi:hypothetical protein